DDRALACCRLQVFVRRREQEARECFKITDFSHCSVPLPCEYSIFCCSPISRSWVSAACRTLSMR
ncbi:uncharacterized protein BJ212DRAFT_1419288, partial [Suillus subaureus]